MPKLEWRINIHCAIVQAHLGLKLVCVGGVLWLRIAPQIWFTVFISPFPWGEPTCFWPSRHGEVAKQTREIYLNFKLKLWLMKLVMSKSVLGFFYFSYIV